MHEDYDPPEMIRFYQSILGTVTAGGPPETWGDCMRSCVASILEIDPGKLPNPHAKMDWGLEWFKALAPHGVAPLWIGDMEQWWRVGFPGYWIATVETREEEGGDHHCVVMLHDICVHDPMPGSALLESGRDFKDDIRSACIFVPIDPKRAVVRR